MTVVVADEEGVEHGEGTIFTYTRITRDEDLVGSDETSRQGGVEKRVHWGGAAGLTPRGRAVDAVVGTRRVTILKEAEDESRGGGDVVVVVGQQQTTGESAQCGVDGCAWAIDLMKIQIGSGLVGYHGDAIVDGDVGGLGHQRGSCRGHLQGQRRHATIEEGQVAGVDIRIQEAETVFFCSERKQKR